jgi:pimeloyl-ACP methyl ester carboxylesterase
MTQGNWIRKPVNDLTVVFVHGFNSSKECWLNSNGTYWPELLKREDEFSSIGIYIFSYRTSISSGYYSLGDVVDSLKEYLRLDNVIDFSKIIFVCHSMGGIVVRRFLVSQKTNLMRHGLKEVGLFLVASPSLGSNYANMLYPISKLAGHTQAKALRFSQENTWLNDLDRDFINFKAEKDGSLKIEGKELIEDLPVYLKSWFFKKQIVEPFSGARYFGDPFKVPGSDHFTIARAESSESIQHRLLCDFVRNIKNHDTQEIIQNNGQSISFLLPEECTFSQGIYCIAESDDSVVEFKGFTEDELNAKLIHQTINTSTPQNAMEIIRRLARGHPIREYKVIKFDGIYTIEVE